MLVFGAGNDPRYHCGLVPIPGNFVCAFSGDSEPGAPPFARPPGETLHIVLGYDSPFTGGLSRLQVTMVDAKCVNELPPSTSGLFGNLHRVTPVRAARLDECAREALGVPTLTESGASGRKVRLTINGAPAHRATRVFGGRSRKALKKARSGNTVTTIPARSQRYPPFGQGTLTVAPSVKFLRAAWTKNGEKPILGPILRVRR